MERKKNGFTLVELLAVIVVLAIIMVIAIPNVIGSLNDAKKSTFAEYVTKVFNAAVTKFESQALTKDPSVWVSEFNISELGMANTGSYEGSVFVDNSTGTKRYFIALRDGELQFITNANDIQTGQETYLPKNGADAAIINRDSDLTNGKKYDEFNKDNCDPTYDTTNTNIVNGYACKTK